MTLHRMFVYGTLKAGYGNHRLLISSRAIGRAQSVQQYTMSDVGFPCIKLASCRDLLRGIVFGEAYEVNDETLARLDRLEGNGSMYQRAMREFRVDGHDRPQILWVYEWMSGHQGRPVPPDDNGAIHWQPGGARFWNDLDEDEVGAAPFGHDGTPEEDGDNQAAQDDHESLQDGA